MPTLPTYNAQRNITAQQAAPFRDEASQVLESEQKIIGTLQNINQSWSNANDIMQATEAKAKYETAVLDIQTRAFADPNFKNSESYYKELDKAKTESLKGISNKRVSNIVGVEFAGGNRLAEVKIDANFKAKQMEANKYNLSQEVLINANKKAFATTDVERNSYQSSIDNSLMMNQNLLTTEEMNVLKHTAEKNAVENLVYANPQKAVDSINAGHFDLTPEEKGKYIDEARLVEKKNKEYSDWQLQQTQTQGTLDLSQAMHDKTLTPIMVRGMQQSGKIDSETAAIFDSIALKKTYEIPETTSLSQPDYFLRLLEDSNGDKVQVNKILKDAAKAYGDHKIGTNQYLYFVQNAQKTFDRQAKGIFTKTKEQQDYKSAVDGIGEFFKSINEQRDRGQKDFDDAINKFSDRYKDGEDALKIKDQILNEQIIKFKPEVSNFPENGKIMIDKNGNKALVFPDGHFEEVK